MWKSFLGYGWEFFTLQSRFKGGSLWIPYLCYQVYVGWHETCEFSVKCIYERQIWWNKRNWYRKRRVDVVHLCNGRLLSSETWHRVIWQKCICIGATRCIRQIRSSNFFGNVSQFLRDKTASCDYIIFHSDRCENLRTNLCFEVFEIFFFNGQQFKSFVFEYP
jgi:hypothetical protein